MNRHRSEGALELFVYMTRCSLGSNEQGHEGSYWESLCDSTVLVPLLPTAEPSSGKP